MSCSLNQLKENPAGPVAGLFRMRRPSPRISRGGRPYLRIFLEDMSGSLMAYAWQEELYHQLNLQDLTHIYIEGKIRRRPDVPVIDLARIHNHQAAGAAEVVRLIPESLCPVSWLMPFLQAAVKRITIPALVKFVASVLGNDSIAFAFVSAPASLNHHHNYPGGLLSHSLQCFQMVERHREFPQEEYELGLVAALFHDIAKTLTMTHEMKRTTLGYNVDHDKLTLELLAPYLKELDREWKAGACELRYLLTWKMNQRIPKYNMADLVTCCDRVSTGLDMQGRR